MSRKVNRARRRNVYRIERFPIGSYETTDAMRAVRGPRGRKCRTSTWWFADWHAPAGRPAHGAQDIFAGEGAPVLSPVKGRVRSVGTSERGGHHIYIEQLSKSGRLVMRTYYLAHLLERPVLAAGDMLEAGHHVGAVGRSGNASTTCPHLHISARRGASGRKVNIFSELKAVDPLRRRRALMKAYRAAKKVLSRGTATTKLEPRAPVPCSSLAPCSCCHCSPLEDANHGS